MIRTIIEQEQRRLLEQGFGYEMQTLSVPVSSSHMQLYLGNDIYVLTGIRLSDEDDKMDKNTVVLSSPTEQLTLTQQSIAMLGTSIVKVFRNRINIVSFGNIEDIVRYSIGAVNDARVHTLIEKYHNAKYEKVIFVKNIKTSDGDPHFSVDWLEENVDSLSKDELEQIYKPSGNNMWFKQQHYVLMYRSATYAAYLASLDGTALTAISELDWWMAKISSELYSFSWGVAPIKYTFADLASDLTDMFTLFNYMQYSTGQRVEREIAPYQLEFVRLTPIAKQ